MAHQVQLCLKIKAVFLFYFNLYPTDSDEMKKLVTSVKLVGKISVFKAN